MAKEKLESRPSGLRESNGPKVIGEVLNEYFQSNEPFAREYRKRIFKSLFPNTELCISLKLLTRQPGRIAVGEMLKGVITRKGEESFVFLEEVAQRRAEKRRSPLRYRGKCVNVHCAGNNQFFPSFRKPRYAKDYRFREFCLEAAEELLAVAGFDFGEGERDRCASCPLMKCLAPAASRRSAEHVETRRLRGKMKTEAPRKACLVEENE